MEELTMTKRERIGAAAYAAGAEELNESTGRNITAELDNLTDEEITQLIFTNLPENPSVRDWSSSPLLGRISDEFTNAIGTNHDIFETLRDSDWSVTRALQRGYQSRNWDEKTQRNYRILRTVWEQTELEGFGEWFDAFKDIGVDVIADPVSWFGVPMASKAVTTLASRAASKSIGRRAAGEAVEEGAGRQLKLDLTRGPLDDANQLSLPLPTPVSRGVGPQLDLPLIPNPNRPSRLMGTENQLPLRFDPPTPRTVVPTIQPRRPLKKNTQNETGWTAADDLDMYKGRPSRNQPGQLSLNLGDKVRNPIIEQLPFKVPRTPRRLPEQLDLDLSGRLPITEQIPLGLTGGSALRNEMIKSSSFLKTSGLLAGNVGPTAVMGALDVAIYDVANQYTEKNAQMRDTFDHMRILGYAGMGAVFGGGLALLGNRFSKNSNKIVSDEMTEESISAAQLARESKEVAEELPAAKSKQTLTEVDEVLPASTPDRQYTAWDKARYAAIGNSIGRWTTPLIAYANKSKVLKNFVEAVNPKFEDTIMGGKKILTQALNMPFFRDRDNIIALAENKIRTAVNRIETDSAGVGFWARVYGHKLSKLQDVNLRTLISMDDKNFMLLKKVAANYEGALDPSKINMEKQSAFFNTLAKDTGFDVNYIYSKQFLEAADVVRNTLYEIAVKASDITGNDGFKTFIINPGALRKGGYFPRFWVDKEILRTADWINPTTKTTEINPLTNKNITMRDRLEKHIIDAGHADPLDEVDDAVRLVIKESTGDSTVINLDDDAKTFIFGDKEYTVGELKLMQAESVDSSSFRKHLTQDGKFYVNFREKALAELKDKSLTLDSEAVLVRSRQLKAKAIVDDMLDETIASFNYQKPAGARPFLKTRVFKDIPDHLLVKEGFLQTDDIQKQINSYVHGAGQAIAEAKYFGKNSEEFTTRYLKPMEIELRASGLGTEEIEKVLNRVRGGWEASTNKGKYARSWGGTAGEVLMLSQAMAHLPLAVISSITEPLLMLSRIDAADVPDAMRIGGALIEAQAKRTVDNVVTLSRKMSGTQTKGYKTLREALEDVDWAEDFFEGWAPIENAAYRLVSFEADTLQNTTVRTISDAFFRLNFLSTWTQSVRAAAYAMGKSRIKRISAELATGKDSFGKTISAKRIDNNRQAMFEIGVNTSHAINAYKRSLNKDGTLNLDKWNNSNFFKDEVQPGSSSFANEIVLNADAAEAGKPLWMNSPGGKILFQFASYPTAFNNIILKRMINDVTMDPTVNGPKVMGMVTLMTSVAALGNTVRSYGQNLEDQSTGEIALRGIDRSGNLGPLSYMLRYTDAAPYNPSVVSALIATLAGPAAQDYNAAVQARMPFSTWAIRNLPGSGFVPPPIRRQAETGAKDILSTTEAPSLYNVPRIENYKGGVVNNVPNVSPEPDEMKIRGLPYTYSQLAGNIMKEPEDRLGFAEGGEVEQEDDFMQVYAYLTKDEKLYESINKDSINLYKKEEIPNPSLDEEMYLSLDDNSYQSLFYEAREGQEVGLPIYTSRLKSNKPTRFKGYVKFNNLLELNIDNTSPEEIAKELEVMNTDNSYLPKDQANRMVKEIKYELSLRDDALNKDPKRSKAKEERMRESKSFIIRDRLLRMGYDAIKFNNGYSLLKQSGFFPTEEVKRGFKEGGLVDGMRKRKCAAKGGLVNTLRNRKAYQDGGEAMEDKDLSQELLTFNQRYHKDTIELGQVMINEEDQPVTANVMGVEYNGKIYNLPTYNRKGGFYTEQEALKYFRPHIDSGAIPGYVKEFDGDIRDHPANVAARQEHEMMDTDGSSISPTQVAYDRGSKE